MKQKIFVAVLAVAIVVLIFAGVRYLIPAGKRSVATKEVPREELFDFAHHRLLLFGNDLAILDYNAQKHSYDLVSTHDGSNVDNAILLNDSVYTIKDQAIHKFSDTFEEVASAPLDIPNTYGVEVALETDGAYLYTSAGGRLIVFNENLEKVGSVRLLRSTTKNAHNILIDGNRAYLLDNIVFPIYVLIADISDPTDPRIVAREQITGINQHLGQQWIDPEAGLWHIVQSESHENGGDQNVLSYSLAQEKMVGYKDMWEYNAGLGGGEEGESGLGIAAVTGRSPAFAILSNESEAYLVRAQSEADNVRFTRIAPLNVFDNPEEAQTVYRYREFNGKMHKVRISDGKNEAAAITRVGEYLFFVPQSNTLYVSPVSDPEEYIVQLDLAEYMTGDIRRIVVE